MVISKKSPAMQKLKELTGGLIITDSFEKKLKKAGLSIRDGYEIQEEIKESIKRQEIEADEVENRLDYLIEQRKNAKSSGDVSVIDERTRLKLSFYIDRAEIDYSSKVSLKKEVQEGKIKDMDTLISKIDEIKEEIYQKSIEKNKQEKESKSSSAVESESSQEASNFESENSSEGSGADESEDKSKDEGHEVNVITPESLAKMQKLDKIKEIKFLLNQEHNLIKCPNCGADFIKGDKFCYNCGFDILKFIDDLNSGKINISNGEPEPIGVKEINTSTEDSKKESISPTEKSTTPNQKAPIKASEMRAINLKFASVVFLYEKNLNPTKLVKESSYKSRYNTRLSKIKKYVREEGYVIDGTPLTAARGAYVNDLKKVLKKHGLMVSGTKDELIQRLGENLSEEELKKAFPKKTLEVTEKGLEFIKKNEYVLYYDQTSQFRSKIPIEEYDSIFEGTEDLDEKKIMGLIEEYLNERGDSLANLVN